MTIDDLNILWLDLFDFLTYNKKIKILSVVEKGTNLRKVFLNNLEIRNILNEQEFNKMALCLDDEYLNIRLKQYEKDNIKLITFNNPNYPYILKEISSPPLCLYCKGNIQLLNSFCIGIVGTRKPSEYGIVVTKQYVKELVKADITIVSGMATGIDTIAHRTTVEEQGKTIAVLGGGFNHIYPAVNTNLAKQIAENNLLVSEYNPNIQPTVYSFPTRNRIIAGLSKGILTTEMGEKSGAMHTVNYALEFNRDVFVVPGRINSPTSKGCNELIKTLQGSITTTPEDILNTYNFKAEDNKYNIQLNLEEQMIIDFIKSEKRTFQEILEHTKLPIKNLNAMLLSLEMEGLVIKLANNSYICS